MPEVNEKRFLHSSCALNSMIYIFCGAVEDDNLFYSSTNSIEKLQHKENFQTQYIRWELINLACSFNQRTLPVICAINQYEIAILGGINYLNE